MRQIIFQLAIACTAILFLAQPSPANAQEASGQKPSAVYKANCAVCHGPDGSGSAVGKSLHAPDLRSHPVQMQSDAALARFIGEGKGAMPSFQDRLSHEQILAEVHYIRSLAKQKKSH